MQAIETTATIAGDGTVTIDQPVDAAPGRHRIVLVIDERVVAPGSEPQGGADWPPGYFEQTFGALVDDPLTREPPGAYEERETLA
jgi:hypothetical protein